MRAVRASLVSFVAGFAIAGAIGACSPSQRETVREVTPPLTQATCVILRKLVGSGSVNEICATADDLLPLFDDIISLREARGAVEEIASRPSVAFALASPVKPVVTRRCLAWEELRSIDASIVQHFDGGSRDAGSEASHGR